MANIFGGNTGLTYEQIQQRKRIADQLGRANTRTPRNVGEGLQALARGLVQRGVQRQAKAEEDRLNAEWGEQVDAMGLDPTRAAIFKQLEHGQRNSAVLSHLDKQDAERRAAASRSAAAANKAAEEQRALAVRQAMVEALQGQTVQTAQLGPTVEAANAGATSGADLGALQTATAPPTQGSVVRALLSNPDVSLSQIEDVVGMLPEAPEPTAKMQNYQWAIDQGMSPEDATRFAGGGTTINNNMGNSPQLGKLSTDYGYVRDPKTGEVIIDPVTGLPQAAAVPGSPAALELADLEDKADKAQEIKGTAASIVTDEIALARELIQGQTMLSPATGVSGGMVASLPFAESTRAGALGERLNTIKANIGFDKLQSMRDASPTGGALGQVSEFENRLLQAVFGSLVLSQRAEDLLYNLDRIEQIYNRVIHEGIPDDEARQLAAEIEMAGFREPEATPEPEAADIPVWNKTTRQWE